MAAPVQADFRIMVLEASNVPKEYKSLVVSWKKGAKCVSTSPATVHRGRAEWNEPIKVTTALCRVGQQVHFQAKFCWLQVALEDGTVVGNDKVNLADCCDGQVRERTLQIYKAQSSFVKLKITIQAVSSIFSADEAAPVVSLPFRRSSSPRHRPSSSSAATSVKTPLRALSDLSPEAETPGRGTPGASPIQRALDLRRPRGKSSLALSSGQRFELDALEVVSQHASNTKDLAPRLMALCLRQLRASRLNALEQEEALQVFMVMLRRSREPSASCGVLFSAVPVLRREDLLARCETEAEASPSLTEVPHPKEASLIPPSLYTSPLYLDLEAEAGEVDHQLCRPLEELQEHLANIRSCALALAPPPDDVGGAQALQIVSAPVSPLTSVVGQEPSPSSAPELGKDKATSWNSRTLEAEPQAEAGEDGMAKIEAALATAVVVQQIFTFLELAGGSGRQAGNIITALLGKLQELARDRELWIHRCLAEKELQYASSLCKKGLHERFLATPLPETAACR